jgi:hypothetical protein
MFGGNLMQIGANSSKFKHVRLALSTLQKKHKIKVGPIITKGLIISGTHDPMGPMEQGPIERGRMKQGHIIIASFNET